MLTAGHVQVVYLLTALAVVWTLARAWDLPGATAIGLWGLARVGLAGGLGVLLAAPQLLPAFALALTSANRGPRTLATISNPGYSVQIKRLPGTWFGDPFAAVHSVTTAGYENLTSVGVVAATLSLVGLWVLWQRRQRATALVLAATVMGSILLAIGPRLLPYRVAFRLVPGFSAARVPARWSLLAVLVTAVLAAVGLDGLRRRELPRQAVVAAFATLAVGALAVQGLPFTPLPGATLALWLCLGVLVAITVGITASSPRIGRTRPTGQVEHPDRPADGPPDRAADRPADGRVPFGARLGSAFVVITALAAAGELGLAARHSAARASRAAHPYTAVAASPLLEWLRARPGRVFALTSDQVSSLDRVTASLRPNANVTAGLRSVDGYDGGIQVTEAWVSAWEPLAEGVVDPESPIRSQLRLPLDPAAFAGLGVRWVLVETAAFDPVVALPAWTGPLRTDGGLAVFENPFYHGEAWWETPVPPGASPGPEGWSSTRIDVESPMVIHTRPGVLRLDVDPRDALAAAVGSGSKTVALVIAEQWDPGWTAWADGQAVDVRRAGPLRMALDIPVGTEAVELRYRIVGLPAGLFLAALALVALLAIVGRDRVTHRRR